MGTIIHNTGYHATDQKNVKSILEENFIFVSRDYHWLGDGVYFFLDPFLAKGWGMSPPTNRYGSIDRLAIIKADIDVNDDELCDMRLGDSYNNILNAYRGYWQALCDRKSEIRNYSIDRLRCAFFNFVYKKFGLKCIICCFVIRNNLVDRLPDDIHYRDLGFAYPEIQMCVRDVECIVNREIYG